MYAERKYPEILRFKDDIVSPDIIVRFMSRWSVKKKISSYVYFISDGEFIKIGVAESIEKRLKQIQTGNPRNLNVLFSIPCRAAGYTYCEYTRKDYALDLERFLHQGFGEYHVQGEWFKIDLLKRINLEEWRAAFNSA